MDFIDNIGFGCVALTTLPFENIALNLLNTAFTEGITHFDTAPLYGNGYSEKILGKFLKNKRENITITTKFGLSPQNPREIPTWLALPLNSIKKKIKRPAVKNPIKKNIPAVNCFRKIGMQEIRIAFENSLKNLRTNYIDYYLLHEGLPHFLTDEAMKYLETLKKNGDVCAVGVATSQINIEQLQPFQYNFWDILQYENGNFYKSDDLVDIYKHQKHFYHSIFKSVKNYNINNVDINEINGLLLAKSIKCNPDGKVLFGTSNINHLRMNLLALKNCEKMDSTYINKSIENAFN